jgi:predicted NAD-dependent protein-ADP-ribosyltransferase YbiA (DUF1768 family)
MTEIIDLGYKNGGLGTALSNLFPYPFKLDGVQCGAFEGWIQSIKQEGLEEQEMIAALHGYDAFKVGQLGNAWKETQTLYWRGKPYPRLSKKYHNLISKAYDACFDQNEAFRKALYDTGVAVLTHKIGKHDPTNTTLTEWEYIHEIYRLRARAHQEL